MDPNIDVFCGVEALPNKLVELVVVAGVFVRLPNVGVCPYGGGGAEFAWPNAGVGDENAPKPVGCVVGAVGVPNCKGFVSTAGLLAVNVNCVVVAVFAVVFAVLIFPKSGVAPAAVTADPNNGVALVVVAAEPNDITGTLVDVEFPNWKALVSRRINRTCSVLMN